MSPLPYDPETIALAVMTVNRSPQYVHQTLASLFLADPAVHRLNKIWVMVGSDDASYLRRYRHHAKLDIRSVSPETFLPMADWPIGRKFNHNYLRCLNIPLEGKRGVVVCEDDIVLRDHFLSRLLDTVEEMENQHGLVRYALALFAAYDFENDASFYRGKLYCSYGYPYYGTPCMYYPTLVAREIATYVQAHGVERFDAPGDMLIKQFYGNRMYACVRALAQHVGEVSTGLGGGGGCVSFDRPFRPISPEEWGKKK